MVSMLTLAPAAALPASPKSPWTPVGPYNIYNGNSTTFWGEAGTLASAASPQANHSLIYAGGQNNGVSSGVGFHALGCKDAFSRSPETDTRRNGMAAES